MQPVALPNWSLENYVCRERANEVTWFCSMPIKVTDADAISQPAVDSASDSREMKQSSSQKGTTKLSETKSQKSERSTKSHKGRGKRSNKSSHSKRSQKRARSERSHKSAGSKRSQLSDTSQASHRSHTHKNLEDGGKKGSKVEGKNVLTGSRVSYTSSRSSRAESAGAEEFSLLPWLKSQTSWFSSGKDEGTNTTTKSPAAGNNDKSQISLKKSSNKREKHKNKKKSWNVEQLDNIFRERKLLFYWVYDYWNH